ncbi:biofilm regulation protein kinase SiaB [Halotalea alkalilenta]|uniref:biofilm regulation protein kinase SiaB n=1 Tax=Halotalea alkalilenta TaxID=376489 RepID=UPI000488E6F9|nr:biofilm regulation protein kinase SiaB [Halotalea alkalilenta]
MKTIDLLGLRDSFAEHRVLLCFNGPISKSLIEDIGNALRGYMEAELAPANATMDVFAVYIEMAQNIRHYSRKRGDSDLTAIATLAIAREEDGHYAVSAGNLVDPEDGERLVATIEALARLDKPALKESYKRRLREPRCTDGHSGAGLGLLDIARKSSQPLSARLTPQPGGRCFFSLQATI